MIDFDINFIVTVTGDNIKFSPEYKSCAVYKWWKKSKSGHSYMIVARENSWHLEVLVSP